LSFLCLCHTDPYFTLFQTGSGVFVSREQRAGQDVICGVAMTAPGSLAKHGTAQAAYQTVLAFYQHPE
jgi:hypothetical protein